MVKKLETILKDGKIALAKAGEITFYLNSIPYMAPTRVREAMENPEFKLPKNSSEELGYAIGIIAGCGGLFGQMFCAREIGVEALIVPVITNTISEGYETLRYFRAKLRPIQ